MIMLFLFHMKENENDINAPQTAASLYTENKQKNERRVTLYR